MKHILFILLSFYCSFNLYSQQIVYIDQDFLERNIGSFFNVLIDSSGHSQVKDVIESDHFYRNKQEIVQHGYSKFPVWLKTRLNSRSNDSRSLILEIRNPHINYVRLYLLKSDGQIDSSFQNLGDRKPFKERIIQHRHFLFPIEFPQQDSMELILEVRSFGEPIYLPVFLYEERHFWDSQQKLTLFLGYSTGYLGFILLIIIIAFSYYRDILWIYSALMLLAGICYCLAHEGLGFQYIWSDPHLYLNSISRSLLSNLWISFSLLFAYRLLKVQVLFVSYSNILLALVGLLGGFSLIFLSGYLINYETEKLHILPIWVVSTNNLVSLISDVLICYLTFKYYQKERNNYALYYGLGFLVYLILGVLFILNRTTPFIPGYYFIIEHFASIALIIETTLMTIAAFQYYQKQEIELKEVKQKLIKANDKVTSTVTEKSTVMLNNRKILQWDEIMYVKSDEHYLRVYLSNGTEELDRNTMKDFEKRAPEPFFSRTHRSYLVNTRFI